ncbi:MAG: EAL domain-containing protein [Anaeromyxobacteraceae bacterium]
MRGGRFGVQYEPLVDVWTCRLHGHEALARFHRADGVGVPPAVVFGRLARDPELLWRTEFALKRLQIAHAPGPRLFLNLSGEAWAGAGHERFLALLRTSRVPVTVEVVESVHAQGVRQGRDMVKALVAAGIPAALDDLGGRDVLVSTEDLRAASVLKLDRSVMRAYAEPAIRALAEALVAFAARTGKLVVAEGVETATDLRAARALGVSLAQGDLFREAMLRLPPEECVAG